MKLPYQITFIFGNLVLVLKMSPRPAFFIVCGDLVREKILVAVKKKYVGHSAKKR